MSVYVKIEKNRYIDSLETLFATTVLNDQPGIAVGYIGMCNSTFRDVIADIGLMTEEIAACTESDYVVVADAESSEAFEKAVTEVNRKYGDQGRRGDVCGVRSRRKSRWRRSIRRSTWCTSQCPGTARWRRRRKP